MSQKNVKIKTLRYLDGDDVDKWLKSQENANASLRFLINVAIQNCGMNDLFIGMAKTGIVPLHSAQQPVVDKLEKKQATKDLSKNVAVNNSVDKGNEPTTEEKDAMKFFGL